MQEGNCAQDKNRHGRLWRHVRLEWIAVMLAVAGLVVPPAPVAAAPGLALTITAVDAANYPWVTSYLTVVNESGYPVLGLNASNFEVREEGQLATRVEIEPVVNTNEPLAAVLVLDVSGSMDAAAMEDAKGAAGTFIERLREQDRASVFAFSTTVREIHGFSNDKPGLLAAIGGLRPGGNTALWDALFNAVDGASRSGISRTIVILETDGYDTSSKAALNDGLNLAVQKGVPVFTVGLGRNIDRDVLSRIAGSTGGTALFALTSAELEHAFQHITDQLRGQYRLRYQSTAPKGAGSYRLAIKVSHNQESASAETAFTADVAPPTISDLTLADRTVVGESTTFSVAVKSKAPVRRVWIEVDGRTLAESSEARATFTLYATQLQVGESALTVKVADLAGSTGEKRVLVTVPLPAPVEVAAEQVQVAPDDQDTWDSVAVAQAAAIGSIALLVLAAPAAYAGVRLSRRHRRDIKLVTCPECRTKYAVDESTCPTCLSNQALVQQASRTLGDLLLENKLIEREDLETAVAQSSLQKRPLELVLLESGRVSATQLSQAQFYLGHSTAMAARRRRLLGQVEDIDMGKAPVARP